MLVIASKALATLESSFSSQAESSSGSKSGYVRPVNRLDRLRDCEALKLALGPLSVLILAMPLFSAPRAKASTQNNIFSQYNIITTSLANSLFPIDEAPLSKFA